MLELMQQQLIEAVENAGFKQAGFVWGEGANPAKLAFVGEAPGKNEVEKRRPFVGQAGKNLTNFLTTVGLTREDIYITNAVKFRPVKEGKRGWINRSPSVQEERLCCPFLHKELARVNPKVVVTLGNVPLRVLTGGEFTIGQCHGQALPWDDLGYPSVLFPLYHPASIIYNRALVDVYQQDLAKLAMVLEKLG